MDLAKLEDTPVVFKCGMYEIMRTLYQTISELREEWLESKYLLRAMYQNGWLSMRPNLSKGRLEKTEEQPWTEGMKFGSHRLQASWCEKRFDHLDEHSVPKTTTIEIDKSGETADTDQTYSREPGEKRTLECWKQMLKDEQISPKEFAEFRDEPWFEMEVQNFEGLEGLGECAELMKTPQQRRHELGIDEFLTSQRNDKARQEAKKRSRQLKNLTRQPTNQPTNQ